jgi:hypothetical protein
LARILNARELAYMEVNVEVNVRKMAWHSFKKTVALKTRDFVAN